MAPPITLTDLTDSTWRALRTPPFGANVPAYPSAACLRDVKECKKAADREVGNPLGFELPLILQAREAGSWDPPVLDGRPLDLRSGDTKSLARVWPFVTGPVLDGERFHITVVPDAEAGVRVRTLRVEYGGDTHASPMIVTVAVPHDVTPGACAFLVYVQNTPQDSTFFKMFDAPLGWDWLYFHGWRPLNYHGFPLSQRGGAWGLPYQMRQAASNAILVVPQVPAVAETVQQYRLLSFETLKHLLNAIQDFVLPSSRTSEFPSTTLAAFSNGNNVIANMIAANLRPAAPPADREALVQMLHGVIAFDPPEQQAQGDGLIATCLAARRATPAAFSFRLYTRHWYDRGFSRLFKELASGPLPAPRKGRAFYLRAEDVHSIGYFPIDRRGDVWQRSGQHLLKLLAGSTTPRPWDQSLRDYQIVHHWFPALFMTDAAR